MLEMLAQDEESRKAELAEKQKALSGAKKRMEDMDRIIQHICEENVLGKLSDSMGRCLSNGASFPVSGCFYHHFPMKKPLSEY